jgi:hypothetical protein
MIRPAGTRRLRSPESAAVSDLDATVNRFGLFSCTTCLGWGVIRKRIVGHDVQVNEAEEVGQ